MSDRQKLSRIGGICAMVGGPLAVASAAVGPGDLDSHDVDAVLQTFATSVGQMHFHGLGVSLGTLLVLGGFVALQRSLAHTIGAAWARLGLAAAIVMTVVHLFGAMMGGSVMPELAVRYASAPGVESVSALHVASGFYILYEALLAPTFLTLAVTVFPFGVAVLRADQHPAWFGWAAVILGIWTAAGGVAFVTVGPMGAADIMIAFVPGLVLTMIWVVIAGWMLWRSSEASEPHPSVPIPKG